MMRRWLCTVAVVAAGAASVTGCSGSHARSGIAQTRTAVPTSVGRSPSPTTSELPKGVLASIQMPCCGPIFPVAAFGSLWVQSHRGTVVARIDPRTDKVVATIDTGNECPGPAPVVTPKVLLADCGTNADLEIDPGTNQVIGTVPEHVIAYGFGSLWGYTADFSAFERRDLATGRTLVLRHVLSGPVAFTHDEVWVLAVDEAGSGYVNGGIVRIDPHTNRVLGSIHIPDPGYNPNLLNAYGAMWVKGADNALLVRIDLSTLKVTSYKLPGYQVPTDGGDDSPVAGAGSIWMRLNADWIARVDPHTGRIIGRVPSDGLDTGATIQFAFGSLWIASFDGGFLRHDRVENR